MISKKESMQQASENALNQFFTNSPLKAQNGLENNEAGTSSHDAERSAKKAPEPLHRPHKEVFSFRANYETVARFRAYCYAKYGMTPDEIATQAMNDYMKAHPIQEFEHVKCEKKYNEELAKFKKLQAKREKAAEEAKAEKAKKKNSKYS